MPLPEGFEIEQITQPTLPEGFEIEKPIQAQALPEGFEIESVPEAEPRAGLTREESFRYGQPISTITGKPLPTEEEKFGILPKAVEQIGDLTGVAGRGLVHGTLGLAEAVGTGIQYAGGRIGAETLVDVGKTTSEYWERKAQAFGPPTEIAGKNVIDNPELLKNASWWIYNVSGMIPSLAAAIIPAIGATKGIQVAGKALTLTPKVIARLAKLGQYATVGIVGGGLEGAQTYKQVLQKGGSEEEAARAGELMTLGAGALNALGISKILAKAGPGFKGRVIKTLGAGAWEGLTEAGEEPTEVFSKYIGKFLAGEELPDNLKEQLFASLKDAATVAPIAAVTGGGVAIISDRGIERPELREPKPKVKVPEADVKAKAKAEAVQPKVEATGEQIAKDLGIEYKGILTGAKGEFKGEMFQVPSGVGTVVSSDLSISNVRRAVESGYKRHGLEVPKAKIKVPSEEAAQTKIETELTLGKRIIDEVKQPVDAANLAAKKGRPELVDKMTFKALKNARAVKLADGPETERLVDGLLEKLPKKERKIKDIVTDINKAMGKRGAIGEIRLTPEQIAARDRLVMDMDNIAKKAKAAGKSIEDYLVDTGVDRRLARQVAGLTEKPTSGIVEPMTPEKGPGEIPTLKKPLKPEGGIKITDSPEFKKWFSKSKIIDKYNKPLVVYHGTTSAFTKFDPQKMGIKTGAPSAKKGFFFAGKPETAEHYTNIFINLRNKIGRGLSVKELETTNENALRTIHSALYENDLVGINPKGISKSEIIEDIFHNHFLPSEGRYIDESGKYSVIGHSYDYDMQSYDNYKVMRGEKEIYRGAKYKVDDYLDENSIDIDLNKPADEIKYRETTNAVSATLQTLSQQNKPGIHPAYLSIQNPIIHDQMGSRERQISYKELINKAISGGHDGVIVRNTFDPYLDDVYVVFSPDQVKSVFDGPKPTRAPKEGAQPILTKPLENAKTRLKSKLKDQKGAFSLKSIEGPAILEDLVTVGKDVINQGHDTYSKFATQMRQTLSDVWDKVKRIMAKVYSLAKKSLKSERGAIGDKRTTEQILRAKLTAARAQTKRESILRGKAEVRLEKVKTPKAILQWRRSKIRAIRDYFHLTDRELRQISRKDIRLMDTGEFRQYVEGIKIKAEKLDVKRQAMNELMAHIREKELNVANLRKSMKFPTLKNMTIKQIRELDAALEPFQKGDEFLSVRKLETVDRTELKGIRTWREARERLAEKLGVPLWKLQNIKVSEFDRFRYDPGLAERNPFYRMMVEEPAKRMLVSEAEYLKIEKEVFELAKKIKGRGFLIPQYKNVRQFMEAPVDEKADIKLTKEELALVDYMITHFFDARNYLIQIEAMKMGRQNYFTHVRRGILEAIKDDGIIKAVKEQFSAYKLDEQSFNILDRDTGQILALDKFFKFAMHRTGGIKPTENVVKAFLTYMRIFKKKQALDEIVPLIDIYAHALTPKGITKKGLLLHGNLIKFVKEWLNVQKGRHITLIAKQNGKIDAALRTIKMFTSLRDLALNIPVSVATEVGEQITTYQLLGKGKYALGKIRQNTKKGRAIIEKYRNLVGKNPWKELVEPSKEIGNRLMEGIFILFRDAAERANRTFLLGSLSKAEFKAGTISPERLAALRTELGRYRMVQGMKSIIGATPEGKAYTQYKRWAIPILRTTIKNLNNIAIKLTRHKVDSKEWKKSALELYRLVEITGFVMLMFSMVRDEDDNSFVGKIMNKAYREATTLIQALQPKMFLAAGRTAAFIEELGVNLTLLLLGEKYKTTGEYKGIKKLKKQFKPIAVSQFQDDKKGKRKKQKKRTSGRTWSELVGD